MLRDGAVSLIKRGLGYRSTGDADIVETMQFVQTTLEHEAVLPWFLISELLSIATVTNEQRVLMPTGFLREIEEGALWRHDSSVSPAKWTELKKDDFDFLQVKQQGAGPPQWYSLMGQYFRLYPTPDAVYPLKLVCYLADADLSTNIENLWLKHAPDILIADTGKGLAADLGNKDALKRYGTDSLIAHARLNTETEARMHANRSYAVGGRG